MTTSVDESLLPTSHAIPATMADISPAWLSSALHRDFPGIRVTAATPTTVIHGTATKAVFALSYDPGADPAWPASVCVKAGLGQPHASQLAGQGFYRLEGRYYRDLLPQLGLTAPHPYDVRIDEATGDCSMVMEDLTAKGAHFLRVVPDFLSPDEAAALLGELARLHARWWERTQAVDWLESGVTPDNAFGGYLAGYSAQDVGTCLERRGLSLSARNRDPQRLIDALWRMEEGSLDAPLCVLHGDCHVGNIYRLRDGTVGLCDWQTMFAGRWSHDIAYFLGSSLDPAVRGTVERGLIDHYRNALTQEGARNVPDSAAAWDEYRRAMVYGLFGWVTNPLYFQPEEISAATAERFAIAVEELGTIDLIMDGPAN